MAVRGLEERCGAGADGLNVDAPLRKLFVKRQPEAQRLRSACQIRSAVEFKRTLWQR
jgi:hypothetical protein